MWDASTRKVWRTAAALLRRRCVRALVVAAACGLAGCASVRQPETPAGPHFSVVTYNVNFGGPRPELAVKAILSLDADVVCLQETTPAWELLLRSALKDKYGHMEFRHSPGAGGQAVLSRLPLKTVAYVPAPSGWFAGWIGEVQTPAGAVQLLNVHLHPAVSDTGRVTPSAYFSTRATRLDEVREFYRHLAPGRPAIVLGDFNEDDSGSAIAWLREKGLTDALREFDRYTNTWRWPTSVYTFTGRFDHILYSGDLYCFQARVLQAGGSDHFPVFAVFGPNLPVRPAPAE